MYVYIYLIDSPVHICNSPFFDHTGVTTVTTGVYNVYNVNGILQYH